MDWREDSRCKSPPPPPALLLLSSFMFDIILSSPRPSPSPSPLPLLLPARLARDSRAELCRDRVDEAIG